MRLNAGKAILGLVILFALMQVIIPERTNPPSDPAMSLRAAKPANAAALAIMERSCRDCHSNDTTWPWYSRVAPVSWLVARDVRGGRRHLNMSEFGTYAADNQQKRLEEACQEVKDGEMPLWFYVIQHPNAKLQPGDVEAICSLSAASAPPTPQR